jgi:hypothetical protein
MEELEAFCRLHRITLDIAPGGAQSNDRYRRS